MEYISFENKSFYKTKKKLSVVFSEIYFHNIFSPKCLAKTSLNHLVNLISFFLAIRVILGPGKTSLSSPHLLKATLQLSLQKDADAFVKRQCPRYKSTLPAAGSEF